MGFEDREYLRDEARRYGGGGGFGMRSSFSDQWAIRTIIIINVVVFVLQLVTQRPNAPLGGLTQWLDLSAQDLASFQIWRLLTYGFCHDPNNLMHILFNMFIFWMFGRMVEGIYGSREFLMFYLTGILISGIANVAVSAIAGTSQIPVLGASGGVNAVVILTAMHFPRMTVLLFFIIPVQLWIVAIAYVAIDTFGLIQGGGNIAHAAHLGGAAFGYFYYRRQWRISPLFSRLSGLTSPFASMKQKYRQHQTRKQLQVFEPNDEDLREQVDRILAKIKDHGEASLTDEERQTLERASRVFRGR